MTGGKDPLAAIRMMMKIGDAKMIEPLLSKIDLVRNGADVLAMACMEGKREIVEMLINKNIDIMAPPESVAGDDKYRRTPYVL